MAEGERGEVKCRGERLMAEGERGEVRGEGSEGGRGERGLHDGEGRVEEGGDFEPA